MSVSDDAIRDAILALLDTGKTIAPREVAQRLASDEEDWRKYLTRIRAEAVKLHADGLLHFIRKKKIVDPTGLKGVYRFSKSNRD